MNNKQLQRSILDELEFDPRIETRTIGVAVEDGVVPLSGHVSSYVEKIAVENAARRVRGVYAPADELEVRYPNDKKTADDEIAKRAVKILEWYDLVPQHAIQITVQRGWVVLSGEVMWQYQKQAAEHAVRRLSGIAGVVNNIAIKPAVYSSDIKKNRGCVSAPRRDRGARNSGYGTGRQQDIARRQGGQLEERRAVENAARSVAGVQSVDDRLTLKLW